MCRSSQQPAASVSAEIRLSVCFQEVVPALLEVFFDRSSEFQPGHPELVFVLIWVLDRNPDVDLLQLLADCCLIILGGRLWWILGVLRS